MSMSLEVEIRNLLEKNDELSKLKLDVIRVLAIFNGVSWVSEIIPDIMKIHGYVLEYFPTDEILNRALRELESSEIILIESRKRGDFFTGKVYEDKLIKLKDLMAARKALAGDEVYKDYVLKQRETIRRAVEKFE